MLFTIAFSIMLFSSIYIILFANHLTAVHKKEMKKTAIQQKFRESLQNVKAEEAEKQELAEAY